MLSGMWNNVVSFLQTVFSHPVGWSILTILLLIAGWKMTPLGANWLLVVAWAIGVAGVFFTWPLAQQELFPRVLWADLFAAGFGLLFIMYFGRPRPDRSHRAASNCDRVIGICKRRCQ
jgi:hypothetical protein